MKKLVILASIISTTAFAQNTKCPLPTDDYVKVEDVLNQFVLGSGSPNWEDQCYELDYPEERDLCIDELKAWDNWLICSDLK